MTATARPRSHALRLLRATSLVEGITLLALLGIAVPMKHVAGMPQAVSILGPIHGMAFLAYLWAVLSTTSSTPGWSRKDVARLALSAFVPFGAFLNLPYLRDKELALAGRDLPHSAR